MFPNAFQDFDFLLRQSLALRQVLCSHVMNKLHACTTHLSMLASQQHIVPPWGNNIYGLSHCSIFRNGKSYTDRKILCGGYQVAETIHVTKDD